MGRVWPLISKLVNIIYTGDLFPVRGGTTYTAYAIVPLTTPLTSTDWDGDAKTTADNGTIDLSADFGAPANIKGVFATLSITNATADVRASLGPDASSKCLTSRVQVANQYDHNVGFVPCDSNGDIYFSCNADVAKVHVTIIGYCL